MDTSWVLQPVTEHRSLCWWGGWIRRHRRDWRLTDLPPGDYMQIASTGDQQPTAIMVDDGSPTA